jgi:hypothetical protein
MSKFNKWSMSHSWTQSYPNWQPIQLRVATSNQHRIAVVAELDQLDQIELQVQAADLAPVRDLLNSIWKNNTQ